MSVRFGAPGDVISTIIRSLENPPFRLRSIRSSACSAIDISSSSTLCTGTGSGFLEVEIVACHSFSFPELPLLGMFESESLNSIAHLVTRPAPLGRGKEQIDSRTLD